MVAENRSKRFCSKAARENTFGDSTFVNMAEIDQSKPAVLILGGCGMIGRNLVEHLIANDLVRKIRVADKAMPMTSYFQYVLY